MKIASDDVREAYKEKKRQLEVEALEGEAQAQAAELGVPYISLGDFPIGVEAIGMIPEARARELKTVCFLATDQDIRLGSLQPESDDVQNLVEELQSERKATVAVYQISEESLKRALAAYKKLPKFVAIKTNYEITDSEFENYQSRVHSFADVAGLLKDVNMTEAFTAILVGGIVSDASDIHIEAEETDVKIRYRIDGILQDAASVPKDFWKKIISRIKVVAKMKINVTNTPQDGRITIQLKGEKIEIRVSSVPTSYGESVVMRLLRGSATAMAFEDLGIRGRAYQDLKREVERPNGMIMTTGPTGSGKTTTLYAILKKLNTPGVKILTMEDPIEYKLAGVNQSQVDAEAGYSFARGLRSLLRQDPDILMIGEVRDLETAEIAIQAALTGHLVVSTLHTNDAAGAIPRFLSMGVKPFLLAPALNAVIGQRLVRRVCEECKEEVALEPAVLERVKEILSSLPEGSEEKAKANDLASVKFVHGRGCAACRSLGYKGRVGIYEIFTMSADIERVILSGKVSEYEMRELAAQGGMISMVQDGLLKAIDGITTVDEVFRVAEEK
ncbi:MAG: type II/IV secretion system protein [Candidatus Kerfeldbacteria bacterium]|nr:type II/IV secretion system protein [Candidatus Kerfeldbacteria bacterium]